MGAVITGTGIELPHNRVDNHALSRIMDTSDAWIRQRTGIEERRYVDEGVATSDLATEAARRAIADAGLEPADIDLMVNATMTPDYYFPGPATIIQHNLGLNSIPCLDLRQQCMGFVYALTTANAFIQAGQARHVLVIGAEVHSCLLPWKSWDVVFGRSDDPVSQEEYERNTNIRDRAVLFGDGAGAVILSAHAEESRGFLDALIHTDGSQVRRLWTKAGGSAFRPYFQPVMTETDDITPTVDGRKVYATAVTNMPQVTLDLLERHQLTPDDLDLVIMHQANLRINEGVQKRLGLPDEKVFNNIQRYGNTTAATIPIALHEAKSEGRIKPGNLLCFIGLGSGLHWGAILYRA